MAGKKAAGGEGRNRRTDAEVVTIRPGMRLSANFKLKEFLRSDVALHHPELAEQQFNPPPEVVENLGYLVQSVLQPIRELLGSPVKITSGYRSPALNQAIGGSRNSQHCLGEAADCRLSVRFARLSATRALRESLIAELLPSGHLPHELPLNSNFYIFALLLVRSAQLPFDQIIHEYGPHFGAPEWIHIAATRRRARGEVLAIGRYTGNKYVRVNRNELISLLNRG